jgi:hypothetical protein
MIKERCILDILFALLDAAKIPYVEVPCNMAQPGRHVRQQAR